MYCKSINLIKVSKKLACDFSKTSVVKTGHKIERFLKNYYCNILSSQTF